MLEVTLRSSHVHINGKNSSKVTLEFRPKTSAESGSASTWFGLERFPVLKRNSKVLNIKYSTPVDTGTFVVCCYHGLQCWLYYI